MGEKENVYPQAADSRGGLKGRCFSHYDTPLLVSGVGFPIGSLFGAAPHLVSSIGPPKGSLIFKQCEVFALAWYFRLSLNGRNSGYTNLHAERLEDAKTIKRGG